MLIDSLENFTITFLMRFQEPLAMGYGEELEVLGTGEFTKKRDAIRSEEV